MPGRTLVVVKRLLAWQHGAARLSLSAGTSEQRRLAVVLVAVFGHWEQALEIVEPPCSELTGGFNNEHLIVVILGTPILKILDCWASLVGQWLRVCLPMQGTRVRALVWEDPTCRGATRPVRHNY